MSQYVMKKLNRLAFLCVAAAMVSTSFAAEPAKVVGNYLPAGETFAVGRSVRVQFDPELPAYLRKFEEAAAKLTKEQQEELRKTIKPGQPIPFNDLFGMSKEEYDKYIECWNKRKIVEDEQVVAKFQPSGEKGIWSVASSTQRGPTPLSVLKYDENTGNWISPNGILERKDDVVYGPLNNLGAWKGQEWLYDSESSFSHTAENILMGKTDDGKYIYVIYNYLEVTTGGNIVDNKTMVLRFPADAIKSDPLLEKAKQNKQNSGHSL